MPKKKLGVVLSTPPDNQNLKVALGIIRVALKKKIQVYFYLVDRGVENCRNTEIESLGEQGVKVYVCAYGAQRYRIPVNDNFVFGGLVVLSDLVKACDRVITLN